MKKNKGFVILFSIMISSILLTMSLGISSIATRQIRLASVAKESNEAFFAADVGIECALFHDKGADTPFKSGGASTIKCVGDSEITISLNDTNNPTEWSFSIMSLGSENNGCASVNVKRIDNNGEISTTITSRGYNIANPKEIPCKPGENSIERKLEVSY